MHLFKKQIDTKINQAYCGELIKRSFCKSTMKNYTGLPQYVTCIGCIETWFKKMNPIIEILRSQLLRYRKEALKK